MKSFEKYLLEADISNFMSKIQGCQTAEGLKELEGYYKKRIKDTELGHSDDISVRDALAGRKAEIDAASQGEPEDF